MCNEILFSHKKKEWNFVFASKWIDLENIVLSKISQAQKAKILIWILSYVN
jgi:hypothetical protein